MDYLRVRLLNTGIVREAAVDLADLIVVMGYNGSGKSTIATVVYAAIKSAKFARRIGTGRLRRGLVRTHHERGIRDEIERAILDLAELSDDTYNREIAERLESIAELIAVSILRNYCDVLAAEIATGFGCSFDDLATRNQAGKRLPLKITVTSENPSWTVTLWLKGKTVHSQVDIHAKFDVFSSAQVRDMARIFSKRRKFSELNDNMPVLMQVLSEELRELIFAEMPGGTHFLPAARAGLLQSHRLVAATMVQQSPLIGLGGDIALPSLSGVVADFVSEILLGRKVAKGYFEQLAQRLESGVLGGRVERVQTKSEYPEIEFSDATGKYPLHRTSSMVSELATLVLLLKTHVSPGEFLIVEEPESHLHPRAQAQLARVLFAASRSGLKIMLTTHSDYFVSELNIAILEEFSRAAESEFTTAAYWADRGVDGGARLVRLDIDSSDGISQGSFVEVAEKQYDKQIELQEAALRKL